jgi:drug/metabolite transporter (DMT)-like permease
VAKVGLGRNAPTHGLLLLTVAIWGVSWVGGRIVATGLPEATGAWIRYTIACPLLFVYILFLTRSEVDLSIRQRLRIPERSDLAALLAIGLFSTLLYQILFMHGMHRTAAGDASLIITLNPVFTAILAVPILQRSMTRRLALGLAIGAMGVAVVTGWSPNQSIELADRVTGDLLIMLAALSWASSTNLIKRMLERPPERHGSPQTPVSIIVWASFFGWLMLTPFAAYETLQTGLPTPTIEEWYWLIFLAVFSTVFSYIWFTQGVDRIGATAAATYVFLVPPFGILAGWLLIDEQLGWSLLVGFVLIVIGVLITQSETIETSSKATPEPAGDI